MTVGVMAGKGTGDDELVGGDGIEAVVATARGVEVVSAQAAAEIIRKTNKRIRSDCLIICTFRVFRSFVPSCFKSGLADLSHHLQNVRQELPPPVSSIQR